jgi:hypothetical protein
LFAAICSGGTFGQAIFIDNAPTRTTTHPRKKTELRIGPENVNLRSTTIFPLGRLSDTSVVMPKEVTPHNKHEPSTEEEIISKSYNKCTLLTFRRPISVAPTVSASTPTLVSKDDVGA